MICNANDFQRTYFVCFSCIIRNILPTRAVKRYGLTEMSSNAVFPRCNECNKIGSVGTPLVGNNLRVIDFETGEELGYNEIGEICLTGPTLIDGYFNNEEETKKVFKTENGVRWLHTSDSGYLTRMG